MQVMQRKVAVAATIVLLVVPAHTRAGQNCARQRSALLAQESATRELAARDLFLRSEGNDALTALCELLRDDDPTVRMYAVEAVCRAGPRAKRLIPALTQRLMEEQPGVGELVTLDTERVLAGIGESAVKAIVPLLASTDPGVRGRAITTLALAGRDVDAAVTALRSVVRRPLSKAEAVSAAEALGSLGRRHEAVSLLMEMLTGASTEGVSSVVTALADQGPVAAPALPALYALLKREPACSGASPRTPGGGEPERRMRCSGPVNASPDRQALLALLYAIGAIGDEGQGAATSVERFVKDDDAMVRNRAAATMFLLTKQSRFLEAILEDADPKAAFALPVLGGALPGWGVSRLMSGFGGRPDETRAFTVATLAQSRLDRPKVAEFLAGLLQDDRSGLVRSSAAEGLIVLGVKSERVFEALKRAYYGDADTTGDQFAPVVGFRAALALRDLGWAGRIPVEGCR
jgi:HEAT repeat protein